MDEFLKKLDALFETDMSDVDENIRMARECANFLTTDDGQNLNQENVEVLKRHGYKIRCFEARPIFSYITIAIIKNGKRLWC